MDEDALHASIARGVKQYLLIGADFDSYALRAPAAAEQRQIFAVHIAHARVVGASA
jgi:hypothetical protein